MNKNGNDDRAYWLETMLKIAGNVLEALAERRLKATMPVGGILEDQPMFMHLEALGRTLAGLAPWLESGPRVTYGNRRCFYRLAGLL